MSIGQQCPPREARTTRRGFGLLAAGTVTAAVGGTLLVDAAQHLPTWASDAPVGTDHGEGPHASCADPDALLRTDQLGSAGIIYELDDTRQAMRFQQGFHGQLERWLADWNKTSRYGGVREVWSYGAYVPKDDCHSWHAEGRAFDISRLRSGNKLLVSCRTDLWNEVDPARRVQLERRYWTLAASLHLHFAYVLTHHFDDLHRNHIHVDNGVSGSRMSTFDRQSRVQNQAVQAICLSLWGRPGEVTGAWEDTRTIASPVLADLGISDLRKQATWQAFLRASVARG